jgi:hypothetical protein
MAREKVIKFAKVRKCLPFTHDYGRAHGHPMKVRFFKICSKCGYTRAI